jgi:hypothetical protein
MALFVAFLCQAEGHPDKTLGSTLMVEPKPVPVDSGDFTLRSGIR